MSSFKWYYPMKIIIHCYQWDTEPPQRFRSISVNPYRGAHGILVLFDLADRNSWGNVDRWFVNISSMLTARRFQELERYAMEDTKVIVVGTN